MQTAYYPRIMVNHIGYRAESGDFLTGDFSDFIKPGSYRIRISGSFAKAGPGKAMDFWSHTFKIGNDVLDPVIWKLIDYYRAQSCGPSEHGYNTSCHDGPIARDDGGEARTYLGGWHSAHDHQRDPDETMNGAFGLMFLAKARTDLDRNDAVFKELAWGMDFYRLMQSPDGYLYEGILATDYFNMEKSWWDSSSYMLRTKPAQIYLQHDFIHILSFIANHYGKYRYFMETNNLIGDETFSMCWQTGNTASTAGYGVAI